MRFDLHIARVQVTLVVFVLLAVRPLPALAQHLHEDATAPTVRITSPAHGSHVNDTVTIEASASDTVGVTSVTFRVDGHVIGTDTTSPYSVHWNTREMSHGSHALRAEARDAAGNVGVSATVTVTVGSSKETKDTTAPTVSITSPAAGAAVSGTVTITASASDAVGVTSVTFRVDGNVIGTDNSAPHTVSWNTRGVAAGTHTLRAEARDAAGNVGTSPAVTVTVAGNQAPSVTMTAPQNGSTYQAPATITVAASAADPDGSVARVDFFVGSTLIGSATASPFSFPWTVAAAGTYVFSASAVDNAGAVTKSASVTVTVTASGRPGKAIFQPPVDQSTVIRYELDVFPSGADPAASVPVATQDLGKPPVVNGEITADVSQTLASLQPGTYVATVTAVGSSQSASSAPSPPFVLASSLTISTSSLDPARDIPGTAGDAANASRGTLWVTDSSTNMVTAFDATTGDVLATIPVGLTPTGIAAPRGAGKIYVADEGSDTVSVISKTTMALVGTIELPSPFGRQPHHVSASPNGRFVYVGELASNVVNVIDTTTDQMTARFSTGWPGTTTRVVAPDQSGDVLYALNRGTTAAPSTLVALDAKTGRWLWYLPISGDPTDFLVGPDGRTGIVTRRADSRIELIDLERRAVVDEIDLGAGNEVETLQLSPDRGRVVVTLRPTPVRVGIMDLAEMAVLRMVGPGWAATRRAPPAAQLSYVSVAGSSEFTPGIAVIDAGSHTVVNHFRVPGGGSPHSTAFDPD